jgi:hypothetical protein
VGKPVPHEFKSFALNSVNAHPALSLMRDETSGLKDLEMSRCGLPGMFEDTRYVSGCHGATIEVDREQHTPPCSMC